MDHDIYENQMIDSVNRNAEEKSKLIDALKNAAPAEKSSPFGKHDRSIVRKGLKRTLLALITAATFAVSVFGFIKVATAPGYLAVLVFFTSVVALWFAFVLLYAQGIGHAKSGGDLK